MKKLKILDLFSGIGGFSLGLERTGGFETVAFCEIDPFCQKVLKKHWPEVPIFEDVRTLDYEGSVDVITGGYPCQPFSTAGRRQGANDDRHLWPAMFNLVKKYRPSWVIGENVAGHINMGLDNVLSDLESEAYTVRTFIIPAVAVNAKHRRDRLWIVAHAESFNDRGSSGKLCKEDGRPIDELRAKSGGSSEASETVANSTSKRQQGQGQPFKPKRSKKKENRKANIALTSGKGCAWPVEPSVGRVVNGLPDVSHEIGSLGNAVVPQIPEIIGGAILQSLDVRKDKS